MIPHARDEIEDLADNSSVVTLGTVPGWQIQRWDLSIDDVDRAVAAYQALLSVDLDGDLDQLLIDMGVDALGPAAATDQHAKVMRADAVELVAAATVLSVEGMSIDDLFMPNVPKMSGLKSDSGIDIIGVELDPAAAGDVQPGETLLLVSVKHTVSTYASGMRGKLEKSITDELTGPYLFRQLTTLHGQLIREGIPAGTAQRVFQFMRETLNHPQVRIVCVAAAEPPPACNLLDQPALLGDEGIADAHFRMLLIPGLSTLHTKLVPNG